jgi:hypothetical protein
MRGLFCVRLRLARQEAALGMYRYLYKNASISCCYREYKHHSAPELQLQSMQSGISLPSPTFPHPDDNLMRLCSPEDFV